MYNSRSVNRCKPGNKYSSTVASAYCKAKTCCVDFSVVVVVDVVDDDDLSHLVEDGVEEELPGGGSEVGVEFEASECQVFQGGRQSVGNARRLVGTRDLEGNGVNDCIYLEKGF